MDLLYGQLPPKVHRTVMAYGHYGYIFVAFLNAVWFMAFHRETIPADSTQAVQFLGVYFAGCLGLFALIPLGYTVAAYLLRADE